MKKIFLRPLQNESEVVYGLRFKIVSGSSGLFPARQGTLAASFKIWDNNHETQRVQVPKHQVSTQNHSSDSCCRNPACLLSYCWTASPLPTL